MESPFAPAQALDYQITISAVGINKFPAKQHAQAAVCQLKVSEGLIYLPGQTLRFLEDSDLTYPFRQRRYFYYLSGVNEPGCYLTYDIKCDRLTLYIPPFTLRAALWSGPQLTVGEAEDRFDVDAVRLTESLYNDISQWLSDNHQCRIYALHQQQIPHNFAPGYDGPDIDTGPLQGALDACRVIKSPHEISLIRRAVHLSSFAHCSILHNITSMKSEAEIHGLFTDICISHGAKRQAYTPIVASGSNAAILHYTKNEEMLKGKGQVCLDAGCEWDCYSSDITRTFPTSKEGWTTKETAEIYAIVEDMQERCIEQLKPGVVYMDLYVLAHRIAIEGLLRLGVFQAGSDFDTIMKKGYSRVFFPHGLGHHIGLEVHDVSQQPLLRLHWEGSKQGVWHDNDGKRVPICSEGYPELWPGSDDEDFFRANLLEASLLQENMVLTVEPGIYFSRPLINDLILHTDFTAFVDMEILARYMHVGGVRIEDDILITAEGFENLTTAPKGAEMLDIIREGAKCQHGVDCPYRANSPV